MTDDPLLATLSACDPVSEEPVYGPAAERELEILLTRIRAEQPPRPRRRLGRAVRPARRVGRVGVGASVALAAVAMVLAGVYARQARAPGTSAAGSSPHGRPAGQHAIQVTPRIDSQLVAYRTRRALASATKFILQAQQATTTPSGTVFRSDTWSESGRLGALGNFRDREYSASGTVVQDDSRYETPAGQLISLSVDYGAHEYERTSQSAASMLAEIRKKLAAFRGHGAWGSGSGPGTGGPADEIRRDLAQGTDRLIGRVTLDGRDALLLSSDEPTLNRRIWIDPSTYLPMRMTAHGSWGSYRIDYSWVPATPQNTTATFQPPVPAGFRQVAVLPPGD